MVQQWGHRQLRKCGVHVHPTPGAARCTVSSTQSPSVQLQFYCSIPGAIPWRFSIRSVQVGFDGAG